MSNRTCYVHGCNTEMKPDQRLRRGMCPKHYQRVIKFGSVHLPERKPQSQRKWSPRELICDHCGETFSTAGTTAKYCSHYCGSWARYLGPGSSRHCFDCDSPVLASINSSNNQQVRCRSCSRSLHGIYNSYYRRGCRCDECVDFHNQYRDTWKDKLRKKHGVSYSTYWKRKFHAENGYWYTSGDAYIPAPVRRAVYERDGWQCQICFREIPQGGHEVKELFASLDHIEPQSSALIPDHSMSNLRMAHMVCNAYRGDDRLTDEEVRGTDPAAEFLSRV